jgi:hypothetical protein
VQKIAHYLRFPPEIILKKGTGIMCSFTTLHKMYSIYDNAKDRRTWKFRGGFKVTQREKDTIWFDIVFRQVEGKKSIEFYASTTEIWTKKFKEIIEEKMKVTVEEASIDDLKVPEQSVVQELQYLRHDVFSMNTDAREQTTPISSIMTAIDDITEDGDFARLSICNETENRIKWANYATWAHEKINKGKIPQRNNFSAKKAFNYFVVGLSHIFNEITKLLNDTLNAFQNMFMKSEKSKETTIVLENGNKLENEIGRHTLSQRSYEKRNQTVWKSRIRVTAHTKEKLRTDLLANSISGAFSEIGEDNELHAVKVRFKRRTEIINELNTLEMSKRTKEGININRISNDEMAKIALQLPTAEIQSKYDDELSVNRKVETDIPSIFRNKKELLIGHSEVKGEKIPIHLPVKNKDEFFKGYVFQGSMGKGKDTAIKNFVVEGCLKHGISFVVPDTICEQGERGMADGIRDSLPADKVIDLDMTSEYSIPMDITEVVRKIDQITDGRKGANRFASELIDFFGDLEDKPQTKRYLKAGAKASGGSLFLTKMILEDEEYRSQRIEELKQEGKLRLAQQLESWGDNESLTHKIEPIINRLDDFFGDDTLHDIFSQPPMDGLDFEKWMKEGKVIILRIPNRLLGVQATKTLFHWITLKTLMTSMLMENKNEGNGTFIVFNEPHTYMSEGLRLLMTRIALEGRKERLGSLFAFHHIGKIPKVLAEDLQAGGCQWFLFANDYKKTFEMMKEELEPTFTVESAMNIDKHYAINILNFNGRRQHAFLVKMLNPPHERYGLQDNSFLTKRYARMYGRHWTEVERMTQGA